MKKLLYTFLIAVCFGCESNDKTTNQATDSNEAEMPTSKLEALVELEKVDDTESKLLFSGFGSEPGWTLEIYSNKIRVLVNYGKDSLIVNEDFASTYSNDNFNYNYKDFRLKIEQKKCTDESKGDTHTHAVTFDYVGKTFKGCGDSK